MLFWKKRKGKKKEEENIENDGGMGIEPNLSEDLGSGEEMAPVLSEEDAVSPGSAGQNNKEDASMPGSDAWGNGENAAFPSPAGQINGEDAAFPGSNAETQGEKTFQPDPGTWQDGENRIHAGSDRGENAASASSVEGENGEDSESPKADIREESLILPNESAEKEGDAGEKKGGFWRNRKANKAEGNQEGESQEKKGFFSRLVKGLAKTRNNIVSGIDAIFSSFSIIDEDFYEEIEEILIMGDLGVHATTEIIENLKAKVKELHIKDPAECKEHLISSIKEQMYVGETAYRFEEEKSVVLVIGVNGVGKTTTVGKLAGKLKDQGKRVVIAAADTFRAAAGDQLNEWANRAGVEMIGGQEGADPGAVVYDAVAAAKARNADVLLCDTAGRLHNKKNLMEELRKIHRILEKEYPGAFRETLVVLDGTTGQNALAQAKQFAEVADITGIVLTKMDGTAKGGIAVAIQSELGVPVKYIGVGETIDDLQKFDSEQFVNALFATEEEREAAGV